VLSHKTYQNQGICYVTKTFVTRNKVPHLKVARNTKTVGQACCILTTCPYFDNPEFDVFDAVGFQCHFITSVTIAMRIRTLSVR